jgi:hypothetical protein
MANRIKNINGVNVEMTDAEQTAFEANIVASDIGLPVRIERNKLLAETDWMALGDVTMTDSWKTYRQVLRDLPKQSGFPDVDFPTKPS